MSYELTRGAVVADEEPCASGSKVLLQTAVQVVQRLAVLVAAANLMQYKMTPHVICTDFTL